MTNNKASVWYTLVNDKYPEFDFKWVRSIPETDHSHMIGRLQKRGIFAGEVVAIIRYISGTRRSVFGI
jgi:hypothetical protein